MRHLGTATREKPMHQRRPGAAKNKYIKVIYIKKVLGWMSKRNSVGEAFIQLGPSPKFLPGLGKLRSRLHSQMLSTAWEQVHTCGSFISLISQLSSLSAESAFSGSMMKSGHPQVSVYPAALEALENFALKGSYSWISPPKQFRPGDCFPTLKNKWQWYWSLKR